MAPLAPLVTLRNILRQGCQRCARAGRYRLDGLVQRFGADAALPDVLMALTSCDRAEVDSQPRPSPLRALRFDPARCWDTMIGTWIGTLLRERPGVEERSPSWSASSH